MSGVKFDATTREQAVVNVIADRVMAGPPAIVGKRSRLDVEMDLRATHANGCPLDFEKLLSFDDFNFWHDVAGIFRHLDRSTGQLKNFFLRRCALPAPAEAES